MLKKLPWANALIESDMSGLLFLQSNRIDALCVYHLILPFGSNNVKIYVKIGLYGKEYRSSLWLSLFSVLDSLNCISGVLLGGV